MGKTKISAIICVIVFILGLALGIVFPNRTALEAMSKDYTEIEISGAEALSSQQDNAYVYHIDANGEYVGEIRICGKLDNLCEDVFVYIDGAEEPKAQAVSMRGGDAYIAVGQSVRTLEICINSDGEIGVERIAANPKDIAFSFTSMFIFGFGGLLIAVVILLLTLMRGSLACYTEIAGKYRHLVTNLISRDLKVKYRRSVLGFMWSILNPLLMALVINAVFQNLFRFDIEYFIVYYLTGSLIFNFMTEATTGSLVSVLNASSLIKKVYIPKYIFPLEKCLFAFVNMLFSSVAVIIVIIIQRMPMHLSALLFFVPMICVFIFSLGLSLILASVNVFFRDIGHLYSVWTTAWLYLTPIIYPVSILPDNLMKIMRLNPMYYYVSYFRDVVMYGTVPDLQTNLICIIYALLFLALGLVVFKKQQDRFILYI